MATAPAVMIDDDGGMMLRPALPDHVDQAHCCAEIHIGLVAHAIDLVVELGCVDGFAAHQFAGNALLSERLVQASRRDAQFVERLPYGQGSMSRVPVPGTGADFQMPEQIAAA